MDNMRFIDLDMMTEDLDELKLSPDEKAFYLYLLANKKMKHCGIYILTFNDIIKDLCLHIRTICRFIVDLDNTYGLIKYNPKTGMIAVKDWFKYDIPYTEELKILAVSQYIMVEDQSLVDFVEGAREMITSVKNILKTTDSKLINPDEIEDFNNDLYRRAIKGYNLHIDPVFGYYLD